jgi:glycosyltransferase involved in cell wall biosynthesis
MAGHPLVSIITPTYNHERYIAKCIQSVLDQTYPHWEQIIIDDGSTDKTGEIASLYDDDRIVYSRQKNMGIWRLADIYNEALRRCKGEYIAVLEGDDFWPSYKLERQMKAFGESEAAMCWGKGALTDSMGNVVSYRPEDMRPFLEGSRYYLLRYMLFHNPIVACTVICQKKALLAMGGFYQPQYVPYLDRPTWLELGLRGEILALDEILGYYRLHERQVTSTMRLAMFKANRHTAEFYRGQTPEDRAAIAGKDCEPEELDARLADYYYYFGRACLIEEEWSGARENFLKAMASKSPMTKAKAAGGMICALSRRNLEWLAGMLKEPRLDGR